MNHKVENIVEALRKADNGQQVFESFQNVPTENLNDMHDMIAYILSERDWEKNIH